MKVSIVIPVYNVQEYLRQCVESALKLNTNVQIVLVDDGSTDGSGALCDELAAQNKQILVVHQENGGLSAARNTGIRYSSGEYIMFLDSDDFVNPEETDKMLACLNPEVNVLMGRYRDYYTSSNHYEKENCKCLEALEGHIPMEQFLHAFLSDEQSCCLTAWRFIIKRNHLVKNELLFLPGIYHEDEEWVHRLICRTDKVYVAHYYFYQYRRAREGAITANVKPKHLFDIFTIMERAEALLGKINNDKTRTLFLRHRMATLYLNNMIHLYVLNKDEKKGAIAYLERFHDVCIQYMPGKIGLIAKICDKILGTQMTCKLLFVARKILKRK